LRTYEPGSQGNDFPVLALGQDQIARIEATRTELRVTVTGKDGAVLETLTVKSRR
jgi:acid phosphatase type 7